VLPRAWEVTWARWENDAPSRAIAYGASPIESLSAATWNGRTVVITGRADGTVEVWDLDGDARLASWKPVGVTDARHVLLSESTFGAFLVAAWEDGTIGTYDLVTGEGTLVAHERADDARPLALCVALRRGAPVCVVSSADRRLEMRSLPSLRVLVSRDEATPSKMYGLAYLHAGREDLLLSGGDALGFEDEPPEGSGLCLWTLATLERRWADRSETLFQHFEAGELAGKAVIVASQDAWGPAELFQVDDMRSLWRDERATNHAWLHGSGDQVLLIGEFSGRFRVQSLAVGATPTGDPVVTIAGATTEVALPGTKFTSIARDHGRAVLPGSRVDHVRLWDVDGLIRHAMEGGGPGAGMSRTNGTAVSRDGKLLYLGNYDGITALDVKTGATRWSVPLEEHGAVLSLALSPDGGRLIAGTIRGRIVIVRARRPKAAPRVIEAGREVSRVVVAKVDGVEHVFAAVERGTSWAVRVFVLRTGREVRLRNSLSLRYGQEDKRIEGLTTLDVDATIIRLAFSSKYGQVMVADFPVPPEREHQPYDEWRVPGARGERVRALASWTSPGAAPLLAAGTEDGRLAAWEMTSGTVRGARDDAHVTEIGALAITTQDGLPIVVSGSDDGMLRWWSAELEPLLEVEIGSRITAIEPLASGAIAVATERGVMLLRTLRPLVARR
jgi:WD40 repeat protein